MKTPDLTHFNIQTGKLGRPFRLFALEKVTDKWQGNDYVYWFKYTDSEKGIFKIKVYGNGKIEKL